MRIAPELYQELIEHAQAEAPNECCGMIGARDGEAVKVYRAINEAASPLRFVISYDEQRRIYDELDADELELGALYHSHTRTAPEPSQTDVAYGQNPALAGITWIIVGVANQEPEVRAFTIGGEGQVQAAELKVG
jgi:proteasome lid subunit RPN8/RPN11